MLVLRSQLDKQCLVELSADRWRSAGLPAGTLFSIHFAPATVGDLVLALINDCLLVVRWLPCIAGCDWLAEPGRLIRVTSRAVVKILGVLVPLRPLVANHNQNYN